MSIPKIFQTLCAGLIALTAASSANAQDKFPKILYKQNDFTVEEHKSSDQGADLGMCVAHLVGNKNIILSIRGYQDKFLAIKLRDDRWKLKERSVPVIVNVDGSKLAVSAQASALEHNVSMTFDQDPALGKRVLSAIGSGKSLNISTYGGKVLGEFSLTASAGAIASFKNCWDQVQTLQMGTNDPFQAAQNTIPEGYTSKDGKGTIFAITAAASDTVPENTTGALYRSINRNGGEHVSFVMFSDCSAYSLVHGWGEWSWSNAGFRVDFSDAYHSFNRGEIAPNLGSNCSLH